MFVRQPYFSRPTYPVLSHWNRISRKRVCASLPPTHCKQLENLNREPQSGHYVTTEALAVLREQEANTHHHKRPKANTSHSLSHSFTLRKSNYVNHPLHHFRETEGRIQTPPTLTHSLTQCHLRNNNSEKPLHVKHIAHWLSSKRTRNRSTIKAAERQKNRRYQPHRNGSWRKDRYRIQTPLTSKQMHFALFEAYTRTPSEPKPHHRAPG
jgi:hypothetical protein